MSQLLRFRSRLTPSRLLRVLRGEQLPTEPTVSPVDIAPLESAITSIDDDLGGVMLDQLLVEPIHRHLAALSRADAADMRVWHWLCAAKFPDVVWRRWTGSPNPPSGDLDSVLSSAMIRRFTGASTLSGVSRNTFARLWWVAEHLGGDYDLARFALSRQDMFQAVFERLLGLHGAAAMALLAAAKGESQDAVRDAAKWLNYVAATTALEALDESDVREILQLAN